MYKNDIIKAIKGFDKNLRCRGYQFKKGNIYECDGDIVICKNGYHAISDKTTPFCVFDYYPADDRGNMSRYCEVETIGAIIREDDKVCCKKIKIGDEIGIPGVVKAHIDWVNKNLIDDNKEAATNTGYRSAATNTGDRSAATNAGYRSAATNTGCQSVATNTGCQSVATNTGDRSAAEVSGEGSVAAAFGRESIVRGAIGCAIFGVERGAWNGNYYPILSVCSAIVDGKDIKADTWYKVKEGNFVEVEL